MMSDVLGVICESLNVNESTISNIQRLSTGMTNRGYVFTYKGERYILNLIDTP